MRGKGALPQCDITEAVTVLDGNTIVRTKRAVEHQLRSVSRVKLPGSEIQVSGNHFAGIGVGLEDPLGIVIISDRNGDFGPDLKGLPQAFEKRVVEHLKAGAILKGQVHQRIMLFFGQRVVLLVPLDGVIKVRAQLADNGILARPHEKFTATAQTPDAGALRKAHLGIEVLILVSKNETQAEQAV